MSARGPRLTVRVVVMVLLFVVAGPLLPLLITWNWGWWEAWAFALVSILGFAASRLLASRRHPDLMAERARFMDHEDAKPWDRILAPLVGLGGVLVVAVAGIEVRLSGSSDFSLPVRVIGLALVAAGYVFSSYALIENRFFSGMVRIQHDRGHRVVTGGPYRWVRHPGYLGAIVTYLGIPALLESTWAWLPAVLLAMVLILRTRLEDATLHAELEGYPAYAERVRYRLVPGVW